MRLTTAVFVGSLLVGRASAQCSPITTQVTYGATTATVSAQTRATITSAAANSQSIVVESCAEVFVGPSGVVTMRGGVATLSGTTSSYQTLYPIAYVENGDAVSIPTATRALIIVAPKQTVSVTAAEEVVFRYGLGATGYVQGGKVQVEGQDDSLITVDAASGYTYSYGSGARGLVRWIGELAAGGVRATSAEDGANVDVDGSSYYADAVLGGIISVSGTSVGCQAYEGGSCLGRGATQTLTALGGGYAEATGGTGNTISLGYGGTGVIGGVGNTATVDELATLAAYSGATVTVYRSAVATLFGGVSDASAYYGGATVTMHAKATVTAAPDAMLRVLSPQTTLVSVGESGEGYTIYEARDGASVAANNPIKRARPTGRCVSGFRECPSLRGVLRCVDVSSDIFNCGGCALMGSGTDCTTLFDGAVTCIAGACVAT